MPFVGGPLGIQCKRIQLYCDNQGVVEVINSRRSNVPRVMDLVRDLTLCTLQHNFYFRAVHVPGINNNIADSLSRFQMERFHQLAHRVCFQSYCLNKLRNGFVILLRTKNCIIYGISDICCSHITILGYI